MNLTFKAIDQKTEKLFHLPGDGDALHELGMQCSSDAEDLTDRYDIKGCFRSDDPDGSGRCFRFLDDVVTS